MGDRRRFPVLADFIAERFAPCRVADVAGGQGYLSLELAVRGFECTVFDPRQTELSRSDRQAVRKGLRPGFQRVRRCFDPGAAGEYGLVVGLHPDGATEVVVKSAGKARVVVVPCCNYWQGPEIQGRSVEDAIREVWSQRSVAWSEAVLPMGGKNLAMMT